MPVGVAFAGSSALVGPIVACAFLDDTHWALAEASVREIDASHAFAAALLAGQRAWEKLGDKTAPVVVAGFMGLDVSVPCRTDPRHPQVLAAARQAAARFQEIIDGYHARFPDWHFDQHRGEPTDAHKKLIRERKTGSPVHRRSFAPLSRYIFTDARRVDRALSRKR